MKTLIKIVGSMLLLAIVAVGQTGPQTSNTSAWSKPWGAQSPPSGVMPSDTRATPNAGQPNASQQSAIPSTPSLPTGIPAGHPEGSNPMAVTTTDGPVNLGPGDLIDISVFDSPDLATRVRVGSSGEITFPLLGKLLVGGMTPQAVQNLIRDRLVAADLVKDPQVAVFVEEYTNQGVFILGEVTKPGVYPLMGSHQLFDFISAAGGFTPVAGKSIVITRHSNPLTPEIVRFSRDPNFAAGNPQIEAGDTVYVGKADVVYVVGDVNKPGGYLMVSDQNMTVMEAIATAEGTKFTAAVGSVRLIRKTNEGRTETALNIKEIFELKSADPVLHNQDIIYIPRSGAKVGLQSFLTYGVSAAVGAAIYRF